jgi:cholinesterase
VQQNPLNFSLQEKYEEHIMTSMGPVIEPYVTDHVFVHKHPILMARDAWSKDIDVIFGGTSNEGLLMCFSPDPVDKKIQGMVKDSKNFTPFLALNMKNYDLRAEKYGKMLKELYYGTTIPSVDNVLPYYSYHSDFQFWHGIQRSVLSRINAKGKGKTFTYYFDILTEQNVFKKVLNMGDLPGCEHGACSTYIFRNNLCALPTIDSIEFKNIMKTINIVTSFAIHGMPGVAEWEENKSLELPLKCLHLHKEGMELIDLPETERLKVWDEVYREAGVDLY